jgi:hypothetical protein
MLEEDGRDFSRHWGYLSRAGLNDKSQFTRQIEKYADVYTSRRAAPCPGAPCRHSYGNCCSLTHSFAPCACRVSNFHRYTPFAYFRWATSPPFTL